MYMKTKEAIEILMTKMENWGMLSELTIRERESIRQDLKNLVGTSIMEANSKITEILPNFYNEIIK